MEEFCVVPDLSAGRYLLTAPIPQNSMTSWQLTTGSTNLVCDILPLLTLDPRLVNCFTFLHLCSRTSQPWSAVPFNLAQPTVPISTPKIKFKKFTNIHSLSSISLHCFLIVYKIKVQNCFYFPYTCWIFFLYFVYTHLKVIFSINTFYIINCLILCNILLQEP